jgi:hypothetical protein
MTDGTNAKKKKKKKSPTGDYPIGYAKPPLNSQFKEGTSGNPKGRSKGKKNPIKEIQEVMTKSVVLREGSKTRRVSFVVALILQMQQDAIKGDRWTRAEILKLAKELDWPDPEIQVAQASDISERLISLVQRTIAAHKTQKQAEAAASKAARQRAVTDDKMCKSSASAQIPKDAGHVETKVHGSLVARVKKPDKH